MALGFVLMLLFSGCSDLKSGVPIRIVATNNIHKPILYSEIESVFDNEESFSGDFVFHNESLEDITLELKMTSCGCLSLMKDALMLKEGDCFTILGGQKISVSMKMYLPRYPGKNEYGAIFIAKYKEQECSLEIVMQCQVIEDISLDPKIVQLKFDRNAPNDRSFSIFVCRASYDKSILKMPPSVANLPDFVLLQKTAICSSAKKIDSGIWQKEWQFDFKVQYPPNMGIMEPPCLIMFQTSDFSAKASLILTQTYGVNSPQQIDFPDTKLTEKRTRVFSLQSADGSAFEIKSFSCNHSSFSVLYNDNANKTKQHWIEAVFEPKSTGESHSKLIIETTHPDAERLEIELVGTGYSNN
jgi:hypothetical protein